MRILVILILIISVSFNRLLCQSTDNLPILDIDNKIADSIKKELQFRDSIYIIGKEYYNNTHSYEFIVFNKNSAFHEILNKRFSNISYDTVFFNQYYKNQRDTCKTIESISIPRKLISKWIPVYKYYGQFYVYNDCEFQTIYELTDSTFIIYYMDGALPQLIKSVNNNSQTLRLMTSNNKTLEIELINPKRFLFKICYGGQQTCNYFTPINNINEFYIIEHHCHDESSNLVEFEKIELKE
jgi:hypothetical protein